MEQCYGCKSLAERIEQTERALDAEREKVKALEEQLRLANCDQANTEADLNDVTAQLATLQAQLRQVEGENELLKSGQRYMALEKERDTLRQLVEEAEELYTHYGLIANPGYAGPVNIFEWIGKVRAALGAKKEAGNG